MAPPPSNSPIRQNPLIAFVGTGALGSFYGARLARAGYDVHLLLRSDYEAVRASGLTVRSYEGDFALPATALHAYRDARQMPKADLVVVTLKSTANDQYVSLIGPLLKDDTALLTLQNGLGNEEQLADAFGADRVLGGVAFACVNRIASGVISHTAHGHIRLGEWLAAGVAAPPAAGARAVRIAEIFRSAGIGCDATEDLRFARWEKLLWNIPFNGLSTLLGQTTDQLIATAEGEALVRQIMAEVIAAARAAGASLPEHLIQANIDRTRAMGAYRPSSLVDREAGRPLEVEAIWGHAVRSAQQSATLTPCLSLLYRLLVLVNLNLAKQPA